MTRKLTTDLQTAASWTRTQCLQWLVQYDPEAAPGFYATYGHRALLAAVRDNLQDFGGFGEDERMPTDEPLTVVVFRMKEGDVLALFPYLEHRDPMCTCYAHLGQHGSADYNYVIAHSRPATPRDYMELKRELESTPFDYRLDIRARAPRGKFTVHGNRGSR